MGRGSTILVQLCNENGVPERLRNIALGHNGFRRFHSKGSPMSAMNSVYHKFCIYEDKQYLVLITVYFISLEYHVLVQGTRAHNDDIL